MEKYNEWIKDQLQIVKKLNKILPQNKKIKVLFRGESKIYKKPLWPSVYRNHKILLNINNIYAEAKSKYYYDFEKEKTDFDKLVKMQHYKIPTKLLDVTEDPDIALYFTCSENKKHEGIIYAIFISNEGIIYPDNPLIDILSTDIFGAVKKDLFAGKDNPDLKRNVEKRTMIDVINEKNKHLEHPNLAYQMFIEPQCRKLNKRYDAIELVGTFNCVPNYINERIIRQKGSFIVGGLTIADSIFKDLLHYDKISCFFNNSGLRSVRGILDHFKDFSFTDSNCRKYLFDFLENFKGKNIFDSSDHSYSYSFSLEIIRELYSKRAYESSEYLTYLLFIYGLYSCDGKFSFYRTLPIPAKEKINLLNNIENQKKISDSYIYPDLEHYAIEIKNRYK